VDLLRLKDIVKHVHDLIQITRIMEIGFNAGHSAELFLKHSSAHVTSFDLGDHDKEYIDAYPGRHSLMTLPSLYRSVLENMMLFLLMVDIARADLQNSKRLARIPLSSCIHLNGCIRIR
jgi:hypothetical protein